MGYENQSHQGKYVQILLYKYFIQFQVNINLQDSKEEDVERIKNIAKLRSPEVPPEKTIDMALRGRINSWKRRGNTPQQEREEVTKALSINIKKLEEYLNIAKGKSK